VNIWQNNTKFGMQQDAQCSCNSEFFIKKQTV
jgi:hypothetical protein